MTTKIRAYHADGYCVESTREMEIDDNGEEVALYRYHSADYDGFTRVCESVFIEMVAGLSQNKARS